MILSHVEFASEQNANKCSPSKTHCCKILYSSIAHSNFNFVHKHYFAAYQQVLSTPAALEEAKLPIGAAEQDAPNTARGGGGGNRRGKSTDRADREEYLPDSGSADLNELAGGLSKVW